MHNSYTVYLMHYILIKLKNKMVLFSFPVFMSFSVGKHKEMAWYVRFAILFHDTLTFACKAAVLITFCSSIRYFYGIRTWSNYHMHTITPKTIHSSNKEKDIFFNLNIQLNPFSVSKKQNWLSLISFSTVVFSKNAAFAISMIVYSFHSIIPSAYSE